MTLSYLPYPLVEGFIHNWLVAGPQVVVVEPDRREKIVAAMYEPRLEVDALPVERGKLTEGVFTAGDYQGSWSYTRCLEDHLVNHSGEFPASSYLRSWAYTQLVCAAEMDVELRLVTPGPVDVWLNRQRLLRRDTFGERRDDPVNIAARLAKGVNKLAVRFENYACGGCAHFFALQVRARGGEALPGAAAEGEAQPVQVQIPTAIIPRLVELRNRMETLYAGMHLERDVFERDQEIALLFPANESASEVVTIRLKTPENLVIVDGAVEGKPGLRRPLNMAYELVGGRYQVELLPRVWEYYELNMRIKKELPLWTVGNAPYSKVSYGSYAERRQEGLLKAVEQRNNVFAEMAKMALGWWTRVEPAVILDAVTRAGAGREGSLLDLAALLDIACRFSGRSEFPAHLLQPILSCALGYDYTRGSDSASAGGGDTDAGYLLSCACEGLAGRLLGEKVFPCDGLEGRAHLKKAVQKAFAWLQERGRYGFPGWGSSEELARCLVALSLLVDLVDDVPLQEMATVVMDKAFFTLAVNTFQGILGGAQRAVGPTGLKGGILQPTCAVARLMWGAGVFNHRIEALVSLACMENYELPQMITDIAAGSLAESWNREQHVAAPGTAKEERVNKALYRTPDAMLASVQDYCAGQKGAQELVWQATLGPSAIVFTNHPACAFTESGMAPGFWVGNATLPRAAQWKSTLAAIYNLPDDDWMGFTHAYFPIPAFDETVLRDGWAFARKGEGFLALTASTGVNLVTEGEHANHELRAPGRQVAWICHVGRAAVDGDFVAFQEKVLGLPLQVDGLHVELETPLGDRLTFGDQAPFCVNGVEVRLDDFPHYENPYTVTSLNSSFMDIILGEDVLRLDFQSQSGAETAGPA